MSNLGRLGPLAGAALLWALPACGNENGMEESAPAGSSGPAAAASTAQDTYQCGCGNSKTVEHGAPAPSC